MLSSSYGQCKLKHRFSCRLQLQMLNVCELSILSDTWFCFTKRKNLDVMNADVKNVDAKDVDAIITYEKAQLKFFFQITCQVCCILPLSTQLEDGKEQVFWGWHQQTPFHWAEKAWGHIADERYWWFSISSFRKILRFRQSCLKFINNPFNKSFTNQWFYWAEEKDSMLWLLDKHNHAKTSC